MFQERLESMSPDGSLKLFRQEDGDIIVQVMTRQNSFGNRSNELRIASVEFCTPGSGGGGSRETWKALVNLLEAMKRDNEDPSQNGRNPKYN